MRATFHIKHPTWILCKSDYRECLIISSINRQRQSNILFGITAMIKKFCTIPIPIPLSLSLSCIFFWSKKIKP